MNTDRPPLRSLSKTSGTIPEDRYRHDLALHDRFQDFGAELLRIASLGLAAFGFVLVTKTSEPTFATDLIKSSLPLKILIALSPICFGVSIALSLAHRFLASDGMFHHFRAIKLIDMKDSSLDAVIVQEEETRNTKLKRSERSLHQSAWALGIGAALLAIAFVWIVVNLA